MLRLYSKKTIRIIEKSNQNSEDPSEKMFLIYCIDWVIRLTIDIFQFSTVSINVISKFRYDSSLCPYVSDHVHRTNAENKHILINKNVGYFAYISSEWVSKNWSNDIFLKLARDVFRIWWCLWVFSKLMDIVLLGLDAPRTAF